MLNGMTVLRFENMPELARSGGKKTAQCTHCAVVGEDDQGGGRAKKKTTIIIGNP